MKVTNRIYAALSGGVNTYLDPSLIWNMIAMSIKNIYLLRHGELEVKDILCGHSDVLLSEKGYLQLNDAVKKLPIVTQCFSSSLSRCVLFAKDFCQKENIPLKVNDDIKEMNFGQWDGKPYQQLWLQKNKGLPTLGDFWQDPWSNTPPEGESMHDFTARIDRFWQQLIHSEGTLNTLLVTHGGVIRHLLAIVLGLSRTGNTHLSAIDVPYAALIHISIFTDEDGKAWPKLML